MKTLTPYSRPFFVVLLALAGFDSPGPALAGSGIWTNRNGGSWTNAGNWNGGIIAGGSGTAGNFTTLSLLSDVPVTLDSAITVGSLSFDDKNSTKHAWHIGAGSGGTLTLEGATPTVTVLGGSASISAPIRGSAGLAKAGGAKLALTGVSSYTGPTTVKAGTLAVDGTLGSTSLAVQASGTLTGIGVTHGPIEVMSGGRLAPGDNSAGTLTILNTLSLAGETLVQLSKAGMSLANNSVAGVTTLTYGGALTVTNTGSWPLEAGDSLILFTAAQYTNSFGAFTLPSLGTGLSWDTANLAVNGSITVVDETGPPIVIRPPQSVTVNAGESVFLDVIAAGPRPLAYQWLKNSEAIADATESGYAPGTGSASDSGEYAVVVSNGHGSVTSAVATLTVLSPEQSTSVTNGLIVYLNFDTNLNAQGGTTVSGTPIGAIGTPVYESGIIGSAAKFNNGDTSQNVPTPADWAVSLGNIEWLYTNSWSVSIWVKTTDPLGSIIGNKDWKSGANIGWVISDWGRPRWLNYTASGAARADIGSYDWSDGNWHHLAAVFDRTANAVLVYIDGSQNDQGKLGTTGYESLTPPAIMQTLAGGSGAGNSISYTGNLDDLGMWSRPLTRSEVSGIYAAGLNHLPLTAAIPGDPPVITAQPRNVAVTAGSTANFSVACSDASGNLSYQWSFNGAEISGATNAVLSIPEVSSASAGIYTVLVSNGSGAVTSSGATLAVYELAVTGQWDFNAGDLRATAGQDLEYSGATADNTGFPVVDIAGQSARVMSFGANGAGQGFLFRHGGRPNGGGHFVNQYTFVMDLMFPAGFDGQWWALLQSNPFNPEGDDAEFCATSGSPVPGAIGLGAGGQYVGALVAGTWYRIAFAVDLSAPDGRQLTKYVNGEKVGSQSLAGGVDGRYSLAPTAQFFASGNPEFSQPGLVNSLQFYNGWVPPEAIAALGGPTAAGLPPGNAVLKIQGISRAGSQLDLAWTGSDGKFRLQQSTNIQSGAWQDIAGLTTNRSIRVPITSDAAFYRVFEARPDIVVGQLADSQQSVPTKQILRAAGQRIEFSGRPVDLALSPDGATVYVKNMKNLLVVDAASWRLVQTSPYPASGASMHGIAVSPDGRRVYVTGSGNELYEWLVSTNQAVSFSRTIAMPGASDPCGVAISHDGSKAFVCLSTKNKLAIVDLATGTVTGQIQVGVAPWDVALSPDGVTAYVSDWGGRLARSGDLTALSAGTPVVIDEQGVAASGVVSFVDLAAGVESAQVSVGLHPSDLELSADGGTLYVANANSDTITVIDTQSRAVKETILVRPDPGFAYGSASTGVTLSGDGGTLFASLGGNNAVAMVELPNVEHTNSLLRGFLPTDWYPGAVAVGGSNVYVVNVKGLGTRFGQPARTSWEISAALGTANRIPVPSADALAKFSAQVLEDGRVPEIRQAQLLLRSGQPPVPVPARVGEPSVFKHVVYILKENKTYDQMFGDLPQGNGNTSLCVYPRLVSPNHHALAEQYVLLDNYYCNGVNSADGHSWSTEGNCTDHLEKSFGGFSRSYTFGNDPLTYSSTGFIWNNVLRHGLTFRNYGEMDYASPSPSATWAQIYQDFTNGTRAIRYVQKIGVASLLPYSSTNVPGWNLGIPDVVRADGFIRELNEAQASGNWAAFHLLHLPNDHTGGPPSPRAQVADNDLSLGRVVEAITHSVFGSNTVIFVIEDDPQSGYDHVDAHRSICLVISPWTKRGEVISTFYNQAGVLHTMERILGLPPMNQQDAMAPLMFECFTSTPVFTPYTALPNNIPLDERVSYAGVSARKQRYWARQLEKMDFSRPDRVNDDIFNRYIWFTIKGDEPYPAEFVGGHGTGLKGLGLVLSKAAQEDDD